MEKRDHENLPRGERHRIVDYLQHELQKSQEQIRKERFLFGLVLLVIFNVFVFSFLKNAGSAAVLLLCEVMVVMFAGKIFNIREIGLVIDTLLSFAEKIKPWR